jgi:hypothetical protein
MKITWFGLDTLKSLLNKGATQGPTTTAIALNEEAQIMFAESQRRVPVKDGTLRRSGMILPPATSGSYITIEMGYGGAASAYALIQHERQDFRHKEGKTWKYLESPVRERIPNLEMRLQGRIDRLLKA